MIFRMFVVIVLIIGAATITIAIFTENFPGVTERALEFIDIPEQDPTPQDIQGAERLRTVFESFSTLNSAVQAAGSSDKSTCYVTMGAVQGVRYGNSRLTVEFRETSGSGDEQAKLLVVQGDPGEQTGLKALENVSTGLKPCLVYGEQKINNLDLDASNDVKVLDPIAVSSNDIIWKGKNRVARLLESNSGGDDDITAGGYGGLGDSIPDDSIRDYAFDNPANQKHFLIKNDDHLCFFPIGESRGWGGRPRIGPGRHQAWSEAVRQDYDECEAGS